MDSHTHSKHSNLVMNDKMEHRLTNATESETNADDKKLALSLLQNNNKSSGRIQCININGNHIPLRLPREQVPSIMWEPGILHGYRSSNQPWNYYFKSLFWIHNETINVWSHLVAPYIVLALVYILSKDINFFTDKSSHGLLLFTVASLIVYVCSTFAHLLHSKSVLFHYIMYSLDYIGISVYIYGFGIMVFYSSGNALFYRTMGSFYPLLLGILGCNITLCNVLSMRYSHKLILRKVLQLSSCILPLTLCQITLLFRLYTCFRDSNCFDNPNHFQIYPACLAQINGILFALHQPEKMFPGKFDIWGHGHQWFHLTCIIASMSKLYACHIDLLRIPRDVLEMAGPDLGRIWISFLIVITINIMILALFYLTYLKKINGQKSETVTIASVEEKQTFI